MRCFCFYRIWIVKATKMTYASSVSLRPCRPDVALNEGRGFEGEAYLYLEPGHIITSPYTQEQYGVDTTVITSP